MLLGILKIKPSWMPWKLYMLGIGIAFFCSMLSYLLAFGTSNISGKIFETWNEALSITIIFIIDIVIIKIIQNIEIFKNIKRSSSSYNEIKRKTGSVYWFLHGLVGVLSYFFTKYALVSILSDSIPLTVEWTAMGLGLGVSMVIMLDLLHLTIERNSEASI